ncbi:hypothetical protein [Sinorhizobium fredii]|uniref:hypothetical protein n=1 Tax=Rhizobium fredii TaxID=380 RepID=UPI0012963FBB|nr:hypothetical protein [Sinorhizobium fredii]MQW99608.1 hypothetical protein [Sinorhizobium fredii]
MAMEEVEIPVGLGFGTLLGWFLSRGIRPPSSPRQGERWTRQDFGDHIGRSEKQIRNWLKEESLPNFDDPIILTIERVLFGSGQSYRPGWRTELRDALHRSRNGAKQKIEDETREIVTSYLERPDRDKGKAYAFLSTVADKLDQVATVWREVARVANSTEDLEERQLSHLLAGQYGAFQYIQRFSEEARDLPHLQSRRNMEFFIIVDSAVIEKGHMLELVRQTSSWWTGFEESTSRYDLEYLIERRREERQMHLAALNDPEATEVDKILARRELNFGIDPETYREEIYEEEAREERSRNLLKLQRMPSIRSELASGAERLSILAGAFRASVDIYGMA